MTTYRDSGVDIDAGDEFVDRIKPLVRSTFRPEVLTDLGGFGGLLPTTAFAIVAQTGNMYNGLWYPIIIAGMTFVIGMLFVKETKDVDIYAHD